MNIKKIKFSPWFVTFMKVVIIIMVSILCGFIAEYIYNFHSTGYVKDFDLEQADKTGLTKQNDWYIIGENGATIRFSIDNKYIKKFEYGFEGRDAGILMNCQVRLLYKTNSKKFVGVKIIKDKNPFINKKSVVNVNRKLSGIEIRFPKSTAGAKITYAKVSNKYRFIPERFLFFMVTAFVLMMLYCFRNAWMDKPENIFLIFSISIGTLFVVVNPFIKSGWDEDVHFTRVYEHPIMHRAVENFEVKDFLDGKVVSWPYNPPHSKEEKSEYSARLNMYGDYKDEYALGYKKENLSKKSYSIYDIAYLNQVAGVKIGEILNLDFQYVYMLGRWFNIIEYSLLMFFAVKILKHGKRLLSIIALMPTPMFIAVNYAYDPFVTGCLSIAVAIIINELADNKNKIKNKNIVIFLLFMALGCLPKAVYIPLVLLGMLLGKDKFNSKKQKIIFRVSVVAEFLLLMSTFVLPSLIAKNNSNTDSRVPGTNVGKQLGYIFAYPVNYAMTMINEFRKTFMDYTFGKSIYGLLGHLKQTPFVPLIVALICFVIITDKYGGKDVVFDIRQKIGISVVLVMIVSLIWTALYLSFNTVGSDKIVGVQGRYYIPFILLFYLMFGTGKIKNTIKPRTYNLIIYTTSALILLGTIYIRFLEPFCM